ncbi:MAG: hypothetical protein K6V73_11280 [Firmicutes bacterium]|nr:hypothetical protein [Bacillota bacterium]
MSGNGPDPTADGGRGPRVPTGVVVVAEPRPRGLPASLPDAVLGGTRVVGNTIGDEGVAVFVAGASGTSQSGNVSR